VAQPGTLEREKDREDRATLRMKIGGMSCSFCVSTIERAYKRIPGVEQVGVGKGTACLDERAPEPRLAARHPARPR